MRVLVADDSLTVRRNLGDALGCAGFEPTMCESFTAARRSLRGQPYDLFLFNTSFTDGSGLGLVMEVRATAASAAQPIILVSLDFDLHHRLQGIRAGANEYIGKPYAEEFVVRRALELTSARRNRGKGSSGGGPSRVLIVDDNAAYANALAEELRRDRHDIVITESGTEAFEFLALLPVDCIVLDMFMPDMSGIDVCRKLRGDTACAEIPVLMLAGRKDSVVKDDAFLVGVDDFAVKSHNLGQLRLRVNDLLDRPPPSSRMRHSTGPRSSRYPVAVAPARGDLAARVIAASGLSDLFAQSSIERACQRAGVDSRTMTVAELRWVLPHIQRILSLFLPAADAEKSMQAIEALARGERTA
jgi:DNA-binding response OmpR family regulator